MLIRSLGFRTDVMLLGMGGSEVSDRGTYVVVRTPEEPGLWRGNFLLYGKRPRERDARRWAAEFDQEFPDATHRAYGVDGTEGEAGDPAARAALGVSAEINAVLTADRLVPPAPPRGRGGRAAPSLVERAVIRPLQGDRDWAQAVRLRMSWAEPPRPWSGLPSPERQVAWHRELCEAGHGTWFGAFLDGRLRAGAGVFTGGGLARFQVVETHPDYRRQGLAAAVVHRAGEHAIGDPRVHTLVIVVGPDFHAIRLYRALGFEETERQVRLQGRR